VFVHVVAGLNMALYAGAMTLFRMLLRAPLALPVTLAVFLGADAVTTSILGLETPLLLVGLLLYAAALRRRHAAAADAALALVVLTRIEGIVLLPLHLWFTRRPASVVAPLLALALDLLLNRAANGTWLNNAADVKRYWARVAWEHVFLPADRPAQVKSAVLALGNLNWSVDWVLYRRSPWQLAVLVAVGLLVVRNAPRVWRSRARWGADPLVLVLGVYALTTYVGYKALLFRPSLLGVPDYEAYWYYVPAMLLLTWAVAAALLADPRARAVGGALLAALVVLGWVVHFEAKASWRWFDLEPPPPDACEQPSPDAVYVSQYGWDETYYRRIRDVLADGMVTGRNTVTGEHYADVLRAGRAGAYLRGLGDYFDPTLPELLEHSGGFDTAGLREVRLCGRGHYFLTPHT
jgi:hypothetical protein